MELPHKKNDIMQKLIITKIVILFTFLQSYSQSDVMLRYYKNNKYVSKEKFVKKFPYKQYLREVVFTDFKTLQADRYFVYKKKGEGDIFLYNLGDYFISHYPVTSNNYSDKISIGEKFICSKTNIKINARTNDIYKIIGYFILGKVAQKIEKDIKKKIFDISTNNNKKIIERLKRNKVYVSIEKGRASKIVDNLKKGRFDYIFKRVWEKIKVHFSNAFGYATTWVVIILSIVLFILLIIPYTRIFSIIAIIIFTVTPFFFSKKSSNRNGKNNQRIVVKQNPNYKLSSFMSYHPINKSENSVNIFKIHNKSNKEIGQCIWMTRPHIKANYFAYQNVSRKFRNFKRKNNVILTATGGFTNSSKQPEGFTVEKGNIVNAVMMHDRHGLVIVQKGGGLRVINLKRSKIELPITSTKTLKIENPLTNLIAYSKLIDWTRNNGATLFQTQLLAFSNKLLIDVNKAPGALRERRILAAFRDNKNKQLHHAIFNIEASHNLASIAEEIFVILSTRNKKIEFILNLDVGSYNILNVFDSKGNLINSLKGPTNINNATNLIVWSK